MADLIDRQAAMEKSCEVYHWCGHEERYGDFVPLDDIEGLPAVDAVVLPCKVRDRVWLTEWWNRSEWEKLSSPIERHVIYFSIETGGIFAHLKEGSINVKYFGEVVFLTREEAEAVLKERRKENAAD